MTYLVLFTIAPNSKVRSFAAGNYSEKIDSYKKEHYYYRRVRIQAPSHNEVEQELRKAYPTAVEIKGYGRLLKTNESDPPTAVISLLS